jgi:hypothetical protein
MFAFERRWAQSILEAYAPFDGATGLVPQRGEVDYVRTLERMMAASQKKAALGLRVGIWIAIFAPIWMWGRLRLATSLGIADRARMLAQMLAHRLFLVRELSLLLKLGAAFALMGSAAVRARTGYDRRPGDTLLDHEDVKESGERLVKARLAVVRSEVA